MLVIKPVTTEKSFQKSTASVYVFVVPKDSNKVQIAQAVTKIYDVTVENVRTAIFKGKTKRVYRNRKFTSGSRSDIKKAYVTIKEGQNIPIFQSVTEEAAESSTDDKKAAKKVKG